MPQIIRFHEAGDADVLKIEDLPLEEPGKGEVRLKVEAISLNRAELIFRRGQYLEDPVFASKLGYEAAGIVDAVGPGNGDVHIGDRVSTIPAFSMGEYGVYGESAIVPDHAVAPYPNKLSATEGASIWMQYLTADAAIQITEATGALTIATTRGAGKKQCLLEAGADEVIVTNEEDLVAKVMARKSGKGADLIFDPVRGPLLEALADSAAPGATIFEYGALSPAPTMFPLFTALKKNLVIRGYTLFEIVNDTDRLARGKQFIYDGLESGALSPFIDRTLTLDANADAHRYMESNEQKGKIVVTV